MPKVEDKGKRNDKMTRKSKFLKPFLCSTLALSSLYFTYNPRQNCVNFCKDRSNITSTTTKITITNNSNQVLVIALTVYQGSSGVTLTRISFPMIRTHLNLWIIQKSSLWTNPIIRIFDLQVSKHCLACRLILSLDLDTLYSTISSDFYMCTNKIVFPLVFWR